MQVSRIVTAVASLTSFPERGRPGRAPDTRELVVARTPYIIAYKVQHDTIHIVAILHGARRWPKNL